MLQLRFLALVFVLMIATLACSLSERLPIIAKDEATVLATRTPLPTFTATVETQIVISIPPTPTDTPVPPPTNTPEPTPAPTNTPEPEPQPTDTPVPPTAPPPQAPAPVPTEPPPPPAAPAEPAVGANGVIGKIEFRDGRNTYGVGEKVFVKIEASLPGGGGQKPFGVLGLTTDTGQFQSSWTNATIDGVFRHEDGIALSAPGNHKIWLSICFSSIDVCQGGGDANWERFEPGLDVIIQ